jgi:hypothetical protein
MGDTHMLPEDEAVVRVITGRVAADEVPQLKAVHERQLRTAAARMVALDAERRALLRVIAMRSLAIELLDQIAVSP